MTHYYLVALGSNRCHHNYGPPPRILQHAVAAISATGIDICLVSPSITTRPLGPSQRSYANAALVCESMEPPDILLAVLKSIEAQFGARRGQRWSARVLDLDIILWSGGIWASDDLAIPHPAFRARDFVLRPACAIAPMWRDPVSGLALKHLLHRLQKAR